MKEFKPCSVHFFKCLYYDEERGSCCMSKPEYYCPQYCDALGIPENEKTPKGDDEKR